MSSFLLAVVAPSTDAHQGGLVHDLVTKFGIDGVNIGMQLLSFAILAVVLYKFAIKPVLATVDERNAKLETSLKQAEEMTSRLAAAQQESLALVKTAQLEANKIIEAARVTAKEFLEKQTQEATQKANDLIVKGQHAIELEHKKMLAEARSEIARLVIVTTERVLAKQLSDADRSRYNEAAARELTSV